MPIYEYECSNCGHQFETMQKMSEAPLKECPQCHQSTLNKLVSSAGFQLKGTGWYVTDFRNKGKADSDKSKSTKTDGGSSDKSSTDTSKSSSSTSDGTT